MGDSTCNTYFVAYTQTLLCAVLHMQAWYMVIQTPSRTLTLLTPLVDTVPSTLPCTAASVWTLTPEGQFFRASGGCRKGSAEYTCSCWWPRASLDMSASWWMRVTRASREVKLASGRT